MFDDEDVPLVEAMAAAGLDVTSASDDLISGSVDLLARSAYRLDRHARREGPFARLTTVELLDAATGVLEDCRFSAAVDWAALAYADACCTVVLARSHGPGVDDEGLRARDVAVELLSRVEEQRLSFCELESEDRFLRRCAAALVALDSAPIGSGPEVLEAHVPDFADADRDGFRRWRGLATAGFEVSDAPPGAEDRVDVAASPPGARVLICFDWLALVADPQCWADELVASVVGRYGTFVPVVNPRDALVVAPTVPARFVLAATLGRSCVSVADAPCADGELAVSLRDLFGLLADDDWCRAEIESTSAHTAAWVAAGACHHVCT